MPVYTIAGNQIIVMSIFVLYLGEYITGKSKFLKSNNVPSPVTGGIICSALIAVMASLESVKITFDLSIRDTLLLAFFSTIGLNAKLKTLAAGGRALVILIVGCALLLIVQDITGIGIATLAGEHPVFGLMGGSISLAGGHGTAIAWGQETNKAGLAGAAEFGVACATLGLIVGGLLGGPIASRLIKKHNLKPKESNKTEVSVNDEASSKEVGVNDFIGTICAIALCIGVGDSVNRYLFGHNIKLPGFLTAMMVGIVIANLTGPAKYTLSSKAIALVSGISLQLFFTMSLMSMDFLSLVNSASFLLVMIIAQSLAITLFTVYVIFRIMGKDYDAAVISSGFLGLGLGATPVAIANMDAITRKFGHSHKAFLVVPLVGAFFVDIVNVLVIKFFIGLPLFQSLATTLP